MRAGQQDGATLGGMFEPQATPYADPFSPYGIGAPSFSTFQPTSGAGGGGGGHGLVVDSGGVPTQFRETLFSPVVASNANVGAARPHFNNSSSYDTNTPHQRYNKMAGHDREAQELAAIEFEREEKVCSFRPQENEAHHDSSAQYRWGRSRAAAP